MTLCTECGWEFVHSQLQPNNNLFITTRRYSPLYQLISASEIEEFCLYIKVQCFRRTSSLTLKGTSSPCFQVGVILTTLKVWLPLLVSGCTWLIITRAFNCDLQSTIYNLQSKIYNIQSKIYNFLLGSLIDFLLSLSKS